MVASPFEPEQLTLAEGAKRLQVAWADGHKSAYGYAYLRSFCPCAVCQGHGGALCCVPPTSPAQSALLDALEVGHYAVNLVWGDGHRTGIYAWSYLRGLCPCAACVAAVGEKHAVHRMPTEARAALGLGERAAPLQD